MKKESAVNQYNYPPDKIRHSAEASYARILLKSGVNYYYQPRVQLTIGIYHPDFYLPHTKEYVEIIGSRQALHQTRRKIKVFRQQRPSDKLRILDRNGNEYGHRSKAEIDQALEKVKKNIKLESLKNGLTPSNIKQLRRTLGLTQSQFARAIGLKKQGQLSNWETGRFTPSQPFRDIIIRLWEEKVEKIVASA